VSARLQAWIEGQVAGFRDRAGLLALYGAIEASASLTQAAEDLEASFRAWWLDELTISTAAVEAGYSPERLRELVAEGRVAGRREGESGVIRVRRCDLPSKPARRPSGPPLNAVAARLGIK